MVLGWLQDNVVNARGGLVLEGESCGCVQMVREGYLGCLTDNGTLIQILASYIVNDLKHQSLLPVHCTRVLVFLAARPLHFDILPLLKGVDFISTYNYPATTDDFDDFAKITQNNTVQNNTYFKMVDVDMTDVPSGSTASVKKAMGKGKAGAIAEGGDGKKRFEVKKV